MSAAGVHCTVEVNSFGQFSTKAKTKVATSAVWDEVYAMPVKARSERRNRTELT